MPRVALSPKLLDLADRAVTRRHGAAVSLRLGRAGMVALLVDAGIRALMPELAPELEALEADNGR